LYYCLSCMNVHCTDFTGILVASALCRWCLNKKKLSSCSHNVSMEVQSTEFATATRFSLPVVRATARCILDAWGEERAWLLIELTLTKRHQSQWRRQDFVTGGRGIEVWVYRRSRVRSPPEADTFTAAHREFVGFGTVWYEEVPWQWKHTRMMMILHNFWTSTHRGEAPPSPPLSAPLTQAADRQPTVCASNRSAYTHCLL